MVIDKIMQLAREQPDKLAAVQDGRRYSYAELALWIARVRIHLQDEAIAGHGVAVLCIDRLLDAWVVGLALRSLGLTTIVAINADHIEQLQLPDIACVVTMASEDRTVLRARAELRRWHLVIVSGRYEQQAGMGQVATVASDKAGGHIMITSGTTGVYKKVLRDAEAEVSLLPLHAAINFIDGQSVVYASNFGLWTAGGYRWPLIAWSMGGAVVFHQQSDIDRPLREHPITHVFSIPTMLSSLLDKLPGDFQRNDSLHLLVTGGALPKALALAARQRLTRNICSVLASTEALTLAVTPVETDEDLHWHRIHPAREAQVVDDAHQPLPAGRVGMVRIRILDGLQGYLGDATATTEFFRDGWFYPGDLGEFAADGRLSLHGRTADVVNILGSKIATGPIERALQDRLGAEGVCVLNLRPDGDDEEIHIAVETKKPLTHEQCQAALLNELSVFARVHVHFDLIATLPRNTMGKVLRQELRRRLLTNRATAITAVIP